MRADIIFQMLDKTEKIETERLVLRRLKLLDMQALFDIAVDPRVSQYLLWDPHPTIKYTKGYLKNLMRLYRRHTYFEWGVFLKETNTLIGTCGFTSFRSGFRCGEVGYSFGVQYWGHGYATEALTATIRFGFDELGLSRIEACYAMENEASAHVLSNSGMIYVGEGEPMFIKGREMRIGNYAVMSEEYTLHHEKEPVGIAH